MCDTPLVRPVFGFAIGHFKESSGGVAAIVCDTTGNTVRQGYCYTSLAIGGGFSVGSLSRQAMAHQMKVLGVFSLCIAAEKGQSMRQGLREMN